MKKILRFCSAVLLVILFLSFACNFANATSGNKTICKSCCAGECKDPLQCIGYNTDGCDSAKNKETGQCKDPGGVTFCPISQKGEVKDFINEIMKWIFILAMVVAPLMIVLGGFYILTSRGDPKMSTTGKDIIKWAIIGLAIILFAKAIISILKSLLY